MDGREQALVERCVGGDGAAFEDLYALHAGCVLAYLRRSGFKSADADDLAQEVFLRAARSLSTFDPARGGFRQWVAAIARNVVRKHWARRSDGELFDPELAEQMWQAPPDSAGDPVQREELDAVAACVKLLPADLRRLVELRYVEGLTTRGVAAAAKLPEATVRLRLQEAREMLQRRLTEKGILG